MNTVIIQWKLSNENLGHLGELDFRHECEESLQAIMPPHIGYVDGGQAGAGTMEIFIEDVVNVNDTVAFIAEWLKGMEYLHMCKLASLTEGDDEFVTHYPTGESFDLWFWNS